MPREKNKPFNGSAGNVLPTNLFRISVSPLDMAEIASEVIFLICCTHLNSDYEVTPQSPLDWIEFLHPFCSAVWQQRESSCSRAKNMQMHFKAPDRNPEGLASLSSCLSDINEWLSKNSFPYCQGS